MRHQKSGRKLNRDSAERRALYRNMVISLFRHGRVRTTEAKAKELRRVAERLVTVSKRGVEDARSRGPAALLAARRRARRWIHDPEVLRKLFEDMAERYAERAGGYTRIVKLGVRHGDCAPMAILEMMPDERKTAAQPPASSVQEESAKGKKEAAPAEPVAVSEKGGKNKKTEEKGEE
jgi:large subunit ribosomal protein L17